MNTSRTSEFCDTSTVKRSRRTKTEIAALDALIYSCLEQDHPRTVRGVFYQVEARGGVEKTEQGCRTVQRRVLAMRRTGQLPYPWISDGTRWQSKPDTWTSLDECLKNTARAYRRALWADQAVHIEIWTEKDAISGLIYPITAEFDVPLMVARGYPSETFLWNTAQEIIGEGRRAVIYQLGDHDPSGVDAWRHTRQTLQEFVNNAAPYRRSHNHGVDLKFARIAVTPAQIERYRLPTRPTKRADPRAGGFDGDSVEVDALPTAVLQQIVRDAIERHIDGSSYGSLAKSRPANGKCCGA